MQSRITAALLAFACSPAAFAADTLLRIDHYVQVRSEVPAIAGQSRQVYVREVVEPATLARGGPAADRVALFIHGAGTPAEVAFDVPYQDYSWMAYLAQAGFDVFSMDMTGYGRSTRPFPMNDPCNLTREQQSLFPAMLPAPCAPGYPRQLTTLASDWHDIDGPHSHAPPRRKARPSRLVARWSALGRLCIPASG